MADAPRIARGGVRAGIPFLVLGLSLAVVGLATWYVSASSASRDRMRFLSEVERTAITIDNRMDTYIGSLRGGAALMVASQHVSRDEFHDYAERLGLRERYPGVQGLGYSLRVDAAEVADVVRGARADGIPGFRVFPDHARDEYHIIVYLHPMDARNQAALGFDMFTEPVRRAAMERARDTAAAAASGRVTLVQEIDEAKQPGFLVYVPVYEDARPPATVEQRRQRLRGFIYSPFRAGDLLEALFQDESPVIRFDVYDGDRIDPAQLLFSSNGEPSGSKALFSDVRSMKIAGRTWTIALHTLPQFDAESTRHLVPLTLMGGVGMSLALFLVTAGQVRARAVAEQMAADLSRSEAALRRSEARFRGVFLSDVTGLAITESSGRILDANDTYLRITGLSRADVIAGRARWDTITPPEWLDRDHEQIEEVRRRGHCTPYEKEYLRPDGSRVPVLIGVASVGRDYEGVHAVFILDLTERKQQEHELQRARDAAEAANRAKDQFLAILSHELRTPLTPVLAVSGDWQEKPGVPEELRGDLAMIRRNIGLEARLIDDLLDLTRIGRGKIQLELAVVDIHKALRDAVGVMPAEQLQAKHLALSLSLDAPRHHVEGDWARLQQVFWNLMQNAAKFTPSGGSIRIATHNNERGRLIIRVIDTGIGIEPHIMPKVFDAFEQGEATRSRIFGGLGLGLAISKGLVEAHHGTIRAESEGRDRGATFVVELDTVDVPAPPEPATPAAPTPQKGAAKPSILLVEDHADTAKALRRLLERLGYEVHTAGDVASALQTLNRQRFDLLLSDLGLPDGSGIDILRAHHASHQNGRMKAIALTGFGMEDDVAATREAGFAEHLTKPIDPARLHGTIQHVLSGSGDDHAR